MEVRPVKICQDLSGKLAASCRCPPCDFSNLSKGTEVDRILVAVMHTGLLSALLGLPSRLLQVSLQKLSALSSQIEQLPIFVPNMFKRSSITGISLDAAGLVALADLSTIAQRTALTGTASFLDVFILAPGIHRQQAASEVNGGELPITGAMTTGYVFRIENQATVSYLQKIGRPGWLVNVLVKEQATEPFGVQWFKAEFLTGGAAASVLYHLIVVLSVIALTLLLVIHDWWAVSVLLMLMLARIINVVVIKQRAVVGWKGAAEVGVQGDLLVLLSQDRWVRMLGLVDDLKVVTSGQWLRDETTIEGFATSFATLLVYVSAALASNASTIGSFFIACLMLVSVALLGLCNSLTDCLQMFGRIVTTTGESKRYERRLDMAKELVESSQRDDWAIGLGLILPGDRAQKVSV